MKLKARMKGGRVHEVGYRVFLLQKAIELGGEIRDSREAVVHELKENGQSLCDIKVALGEQIREERLDRIESDISKLKAKVGL